MVLLGLAVGKTSTPIDDVFQRTGRATEPYSGLLLFFTDPRVLTVILVVAVGITLWRKRWRLAVVMVLCPEVAVYIERGFKLFFGRNKGGALAYPSGHTTLAVTVLGMVLLAAGAALWSRVLAGVFVTLGMLGAGDDVPLLHRHHRGATARIIVGVCRGAAGGRGGPET